MKSLSIILSFVLFSSCCASNKASQVMVTSNEKASEILVSEINTASEETTQNTENTVVIDPANVSEEIISEEETEVLSETQSEAFDHSAWHRILQEFVDTEGKVNYKGLKTDRTLLKNYIASLSRNMPTENWTKNDKLAYWINAYNAMTVDLILRNYPVKSIKDIEDPWDQRLWNLGSKWYNLDEIEHQILRKMDEPRIHFGIVCASYSCPKLLNEAFTAENIEAQLTRATKEFLSDSKRNQITENELRLSKIFQWFSKDFKNDGGLIDFLNRYTEISISENAKKKFMDYNWDLNE